MAPLFAGKREGEPAGLVRLGLVGLSLFAEAAADFEERGARCPAPDVARDGVEKSRQEGRPKMPAGQIERVQDRQGLERRVRDPEPVSPGGLVGVPVHEGIVHGLEETRGGGGVREAILDRAQGLAQFAGRRRRRQTARQPVVAVDAQDLFDQVVFAAHVLPKERDLDGEALALALGRKPQPPQGLFRDVQRHAAVSRQQPQAREAQRRLAHPEEASVRVQEPGSHRAAGRLDQQARGQIQGSGDRLQVRSAFEPVRSIGVHAQAPGGLANRHRVPPRGLEQDVRGLLRDGRVEAAHDPGERNRTLGVGDHDIRRVEKTFHAVEGDEGFAPGRLADDQEPAPNLVEIEGVQGLRRVPEHVVGRVDGRGNGLGADRREAPPDRLGRGAVGDAAHDARAEAPAELRYADHDGDQVLGGLALRGRLGVARVEVLQRQPGHRRHLAGQTPVPHRVGAIGRDVRLQDRVALREVSRLDRDAGLVEQLAHALGAACRRDVDEIAEPVERELHAGPAN